MEAEKRYRFYDVVAHTVIIWYSLVAVALSVFQDQIKLVISFSDQANVFLSVSLLVVSLTLYGFRFGETADKYKACYHDLQRLSGKFDTDTLTNRLNEEYVSILDKSPNHSTRDYERVIIANWLQGTPIKDSHGGIHTPYWMLFRWALLWGWRSIWTAGVYAAPLLVLSIAYIFSADT
jgi:hypothetical protein